MSRLTAQQETDQAFFERARNRSPKFPPLSEAIERHRRQREAFAARTMIIGIFAGSVYSFWSGFGFAVAGLSFIGLAATCLYAGNRQYKRNGGERRVHRPF